MVAARTRAEDLAMTNEAATANKQLVDAFIQALFTGRSRRAIHPSIIGEFSAPDRCQELPINVRSASSGIVRV
jgi:hypothetical protein